MHTTGGHSVNWTFVPGEARRSAEERPGKVPYGYRFGFQGQEKDDEIHGATGTSYDFGARLYDPRVGRWLSLDPLAEKHPSASPYAFVLNNPLLYIDPNGEDNVIYLVYLPSEHNKLTVEDAANIASAANDNFKNLGLCTQVVLVDMSNGKNQNFDPRVLDRTDATAVLGTHNDVIGFVANYDRDFSIELHNEWQGGKHNPEHSQNNHGTGRFIAIDANGIEGFGADVLVGTDKASTGALSVNHGAGHNAGQNHFLDGTPRQSFSPIMMDANRMNANLRDPSTSYNSVEDILAAPNTDYKDAMKDRFGDNNPSRSYVPE